MLLRPYQAEAVSSIRECFARGQKSVLYQAPTGSGKTALTAWMVKAADERGMGSWFVVHRRELINQSMRAFESIGVPYGVISSGYCEEPKHRVQIASIQTLVRRMHRHARPAMVIFDEAHHMAANTWSRVADQLRGVYQIGLTATPCRLDGTGLRGWFDTIVTGPTVRTLTNAGWLAPYRIFAPRGISVAGLHKRMGDYDKKELEAVVNKPSITGDAVSEYQKIARGGRAVAFCVSVEHSKEVAQAFNASGIPAAHVDGDTPHDVRDRCVQDFSDGRTRVLTNVDLFGEGFDLPALQVSILLRPTQSLGLYLQQVGRSLRPGPGKTAIIIDHARNCELHGLPDDEREWSLDGVEKRKSIKQEVKVQICPRCFAAQKPAKACKFCGYVLPPVPRVVEEKIGDLVEVDKDALARQRKKERQALKSYEETVEYGETMGYKPGWARTYWLAKQAARARYGHA